MFQNNNTAIIKRIAKTTRKTEKRLNVTATVMIVLSVALSFAMCLFMLAQERDYDLVKQNMPQINVLQVSDDMIQKMSQDQAFSQVSVNSKIDSYTNIDYSVSIMYMDHSYLNGKGKETEGRMPEAANEVLLDSYYAQRLNVKTGDTVSLKVNGQEKEFTVTGLLRDVKKTSSDSRNYMVIVSKEFLNQSSKPVLYNAGLYLPNGSQLREEEVQQKMEEVQQNYQLSKENLSLNNSVFMKNNSLKSSFSQTGVLLGLTVFIFVAAAIVIYSLFYISVSQKTRQYGQLRAIGTTKKQIKKLVRSIGFSFLKTGLPLGLVVGGFAGYAMDNNGWYWPNTGIAAVVVACLSAICILLAVSAPASKAAEITPIEAVRYSGYESANLKVSQKTHRSITPISLAKMNFIRDRKKVASTLLSLAIGGILFVVVSGISASYYPENEVREHYYPNGGSYSISVDEINQSQESKLMEKVQKIPGVEKTYSYYDIAHVHTDANGWNQELNSMFCTKNDFKFLTHTLEGTIDYDAMVRENGVVFRRYRQYTDLGVDCHPGDQINVQFNESGKTVTDTFKVFAVVSGAGTTSFGSENAPVLFFPMDTESKIADSKKLDSIEVVTDPSAVEETGTALQNFVDQTDGVELSSYEAKVQAAAAMPGIVFTGLRILSIFIVLFGLINYLNTTITNFFTQKRERGMLQAVGTTKSQLAKMFFAEGLYYMVGMLACMLILGPVVLRLIIKAINNVSYVFTFPVVPVVVFTVTLLIIQMLLTVYTMRTMRKEFLVESLAGNE
ncbi:hypothetical protein A7X67_17065 [Clostridium sp. W14A]|nr:hypothetical protein A7X67_17065 [Clostridium sp. W14A]